MGGLQDNIENIGGCNLRVSICIVALNEERYLPGILEDVLRQTYLHDKTEILLIDSKSTDNTKKIMIDFSIKYQDNYWQIRVLDNAGQRQANGWNVALENYRGEAIIRIDAHAHIPIDFVEKNIECLKRGERVCGGRRPCIAEEDTFSSRLLLSAESAMFGSGISNFRNSEKSGYVKSIFHGCYRREVFDKVGRFDERLGRTEDNDIHQRIRAAGYKIFMDKDIVSYQYVRPTLWKMFKQKFMNGYWIGKTVYINPKCLSAYYFAPLVFIIMLFGSLLVSTLGCVWPLMMLMIAYGSVIILSTFCSVWERKDIRFIAVGLICFMMHICYGWGTLRGLFKL
ncbi:glycosyltransferase family 2 protein [Selenomonas ruminis]|uniref:Glycosyltransferase family 2 protein n=1 Tax=Selenomonas ruminis TaxID=2593411 RepID=A0A5D6W877_9FIRM|nr:glycosyltransferase family 2 protein [Selenomonas sp. mPRGC5]TYZ24503.1 glycosyltransferase family 2 protein [Selenomonas sp. mPRGC5]